MPGIVKKIMAMALLITLTCVNLIFVGSYFTGEVIAVVENFKLEEQNIKTSNENVEFDAYFACNGEYTHSTVTDITNNLKLYLKIKVSKGYLKDAQITFLNTNYEISGEVENLQYVQSVDTKNNIINLNQIAKGTEIEIEIPVTAKKDDIYNLNNLVGESTASLKGEYLTEDGNEEEITSNVTVFMQWTGDIEAELLQQMHKYLLIENEEAKTVLLQTIIKSKLTDNKLPIKQTDIYIEVPTLSGKSPVRANVVAQSTLGTNGNDFKQVSYEYNEDNKTLHIKTTNEAEKNIVKWAKNAEDEYLVTYLYTLEKENNIEDIIELKAKNEITAYTNAKATSEENKSYTLKNIENKNVTNKLEIKEDSLYKGYIYSGVDYETEYEVTNTLNITYGKEIEGISLNCNEDIFVLQDGQELLGEKNTYYKQTTISKEEFEKTLGEDGKINIYNSENELIGTINKETKVDEEGNFTIVYETKPEEIKIETSKVLDDILGTNIKIINKKAVAGKTSYTLEQIKNMAKLKIITKLDGKENLAELNLKETEKKSEIKTNNNINNISTIQENTVELLITLKATDNKYELSNNPKIEITLPSEFSSSTVGDIVLLNESELKVESKQIEINELGEMVILITLSGKQTKYKLQDTTLLIPITIPEMKEVESRTVELKMKYENEETGKQEENSINMELTSNYNLFALNETSEEENENIVEETESKLSTMFYVANASLSANSLENAKVSVVKTANKSGPVKNGDEIIYTISIRNEGSIDARDVKLIENLPEGLEGISIKYQNYDILDDSYDDGIRENDGDDEPYEEEEEEIEDQEDSRSFDEFANMPSSETQVKYNPSETVNNLQIPTGKTLDIIVTTKVNIEGKDNIEEISNTAIVRGSNIEETRSNTVTLKVKREEQQEQQNNGQTSGDMEEIRKYKLSGIAWLDENRNGIRETDEKLLSEIPVKLYNANTDEILRQTNTLENGSYEFIDLDRGSYIVIFEYDVQKYNVTEYQKIGISTILNSDVISGRKVIGGIEKQIATTDIIEINSQDRPNIDIGIFEKPKFDMSLNKTVTKITVQNEQGTKTYNYKNGKMAKVELVSKYVSGTNIIIEYNLAVTNQGKISGYVNKVIDYLPRELKFSSDLNPNWYITQNGEIYNLSIENKEIKPGETINLTLVLSKTLTENDTGLIVNNGKIVDSANVEGIEEDSLAKENDFSTAEVVISIKTGKDVLNVTIIIISLIVLTSGIILIKKKVLG